ncbi:ParB/RepB/Spo0J family partition protein [Tepidibacillus marianensis]|uniref:ParB/RepB/Spo0J family partition protein n=1 Tax=Tepidibacillus marianensis TaxID=3131995 RepID=UPI0030D3B6F3
MNKRLGRGLEALIPSLEVDDLEKVSNIDLNRIRPNPYQPRKAFHQDQLADLMSSIKEHGIIQPIIVRKALKGYEIVAGERRWRASKELQLETIPAVIKDFSDQQVMEIALIENLQREDLNAIEIANAYEKLMKSFRLTQEELAARVGKSRPHVANLLRLLQLPRFIQQELMNGHLTMGHARTLITLDSEEKQIYYASKAIERGWSVRTLEEKIQQEKDNVSRETLNKKSGSSTKVYLHIEEQLRETFKTSVKIKQGKKKGKIEIEYFDQSDLQRILDLMGV